MSAQAQVSPIVVSTPELICRRFRLLAKRRIAWLQALAVSESASGTDFFLEERDTPGAESNWFKNQPWSAEWTAEVQEAEGALQNNTSSFLARMQAIFGLSETECDLLQACAVVALEPALRSVCGYLADDARRNHVTEELVASLYGPRNSGISSAESALFRWELIVAHETAPGEPRALSLDTQIRERFLGYHTLPDALVGAARLHEPVEYIGSLPVEETARTIERHLHGQLTKRLRVVIEGARGSGRKTLAGAISARLCLPLLLINADEIDDRCWRRAYVLAQRHAYLESVAVGWYGEAISRRPWPTGLPSFPVQFVLVDTGTSLAPLDGVIEHRVRVPSLSTADRAALWRSHLPVSNEWPEEELCSLAERYRVQPGDIAAVAAGSAETAQEAATRVREISRGRLAGLAQLLRCSFTSSDLVVPSTLQEALEDIVFEANHRASLWDDAEANRLFPQGQGLMALLSGPPGTGKTMAAQVIAGTLGYDLFRVDLAGVVSKWVGETSQNFERILSRAADMHAIILFDECDAIFNKRTSDVQDAQDKFANTDAAYLLQAMESYPGVALLATNQKGNIDPAFIRRLRYVLEFTKPDGSQRFEIWRKVVSGLCGEDRRDALESALRVLADSVETTGAQIKFATLGAVFAAKRDSSSVELRHLVRGLNRELAKEGRALGVRERDRILSHGS